MAYDKIHEFAVALHSVFKMINKRAQDTSNNKMGHISLLIYKYYFYIVSTHKLDHKVIEETDDKIDVNLIPIFEYIAHNNIELFDFANITLADVDTSKKEDTERFVLSHIYYLTQK
jgi:hypothetical protein